MTSRNCKVHFRSGLGPEANQALRMLQEFTGLSKGEITRRVLLAVVGDPRMSFIFEDIPPQIAEIALSEN